MQCSLTYFSFPPPLVSLPCSPLFCPGVDGPRLRPSEPDAEGGSLWTCLRAHTGRWPGQITLAKESQLRGRCNHEHTRKLQRGICLPSWVKDDSGVIWANSCLNNLRNLLSVRFTEDVLDCRLKILYKSNYTQYSMKSQLSECLISNHESQNGLQNHIWYMFVGCSFIVEKPLMCHLSVWWTQNYNSTLSQVATSSLFNLNFFFFFMLSCLFPLLIITSFSCQNLWYWWQCSVEIIDTLASPKKTFVLVCFLLIFLQVWFERRTNYTRSLAVMSMVGYILGLGDRYVHSDLTDEERRMSGREELKQLSQKKKLQCRNKYIPVITKSIYT